jgi:hypothetical protein
MRLRPASAQSDHNPCCSLSVSLLDIGFVRKQHGSLTDCADAQAGLNPSSFVFGAKQWDYITFCYSFEFAKSIKGIIDRLYIIYF